jgi:hypothetical protein
MRQAIAPPGAAARGLDVRAFYGLSPDRGSAAAAGA